MKQAFLDSLVGLSMAEAREKVGAAGHEHYDVPAGCAMTMEAKPNTVVLWEKDGRVKATSAGDGLELED